MKTKQRSCLKKAVLNSMLLGSLVANSLVFADCNAFIARTTPDASFQDNLDGTVTSLETGLMWQKCPHGQSWNTGSDANNSMDDRCDGPTFLQLLRVAEERNITVEEARKIGITWQQALDAAQGANANTAFGYDDWYLPNAKELNSLVERACYDPAINSALFPNTLQPETTSYYWSATPDVTIFTPSHSYLPPRSDQVWYVNFENGEVRSTWKNHESENYNPGDKGPRSFTARLVRVSQ